jgi:hypothetical protein
MIGAVAGANGKGIKRKAADKTGASNGEAPKAKRKVKEAKPLPPEAKSSEIAKRPKVKKPGEVSVSVYRGDGGQGQKPSMTVADAKDLIGWRVVEYASKGDETPEKTLMKFHLRDNQGNKVLLYNNDTNRPIRPGLYKRYALEILRNKWKLNGATIVFDEEGKCSEGQHRLIGLIIAEEIRRKEPLKWAKYGWGGPDTKSQLCMDALVVRGISSDPDVKDTQNLGQKQTGGDVVYRRDYFGSEKTGDGPRPVNDTKRRRLSSILAGAARLVWLRTMDKKVVDAPHFPPSEMLDFIDAHPKLIEYTYFIHDLEVKSKGGAISKGGGSGGGMSLGYATGLCYLMAVSSTNPDKWLEEGVSAINFKAEKKALQFWEKFASPTNIGDTDPIYNLLNMIRTIDSGSGQGRDELVGMTIKAFHAFSDGLEVGEKDLAIRRMRNNKGDEVLAEDPRLGGIDVQGRPEVEGEDVDSVEETREGSKAGKQWAEGDECWVLASDGDHWFGSITDVVKHDDGTHSAMIVDADSGNEYQEEFTVLDPKTKKVKDNKKLCLSYPGA